MPRQFDESDDEWEDPGPDEPDEDEDDDHCVPCPYCSRSIHEDAERCPHCESYISREDARPVRKPVWIIITAVIVLGLVYMWTVKN